MTAPRRAVLALGVLCQGTVLATWARPAAAHALAVLALAGALAALVWWHAGRTGPRGEALAATLALGGAGMVVGTWLDWHLGVPDCLCCLFAPGRPPGPALRSLLAGQGTALMVLLPLLYRASRRGAGGTAAPRRWLRLGGQVVAMCGGMAAAAYLGSFVVRLAPAGKLEAGHLTMLAGMAAGCALVGRQQIAASR